MVKERPSGATERLYGTTTNVYLRWLDVSYSTAERLARVARVWIDETLGAQQDLAQTARRAVEETRAAFSAERPPATEQPGRAVDLARVSDLARSSSFLWTEAGLKVLERYDRVAQTAIDELQGVHTELTDQMARLARRPTLVRTGA